MGQSRLISNLASYFKIKQTDLRDKLDHTSLKEKALVMFDSLDIKLPPFYLASVNIDLNQFMTAANMAKSKVGEAYNIMLAGKGRERASLVIYDGALFIVCDVRRLDIGGGVGGLYFHYPPQFEHKILLPFKTYLTLQYPHPSNQI